MQKYIMVQLEEHRNEQIMFWGASNFLNSFISNPEFKHYNILGIIDTDKGKQDTYMHGYKIFSPDCLNELKPVCIIDTVINKYLKNYNIIKNIISELYNPNEVKLLPNVLHTYYNNPHYNIDLSEKNLDFEFVVSTEKEIEFFKNLGSEYLNYVEMCDSDRLFLATLILRNKPKKILEVGVSRGGSSFLILNTMNTYKDAKLYSLDYNTEHYTNDGTLTGAFINKFPNLKQNWNLNTGGLALNFLDKIASSTNENEKFDFCFLDTMHALPGEILDFLQILPYMKENSILVFHDTNLQVISPQCFVNNLLMSSIRGPKLIPYPEPYLHSPFNNAGAVKITKDTFSLLYGVFNLLAIPWQYKLKYEEIKLLIEFFDKHYPAFYANYFKEIILLQEKISL